MGRCEPPRVTREQRFETLDANRNSYLDADELAEWVDDKGMFTRWDSDRDSQVDTDEVNEAIYTIRDDRPGGRPRGRSGRDPPGKRSRVRVATGPRFQRRGRPQANSATPIMTEPDQRATHSDQLARDLSLFDITMIGLGAMIGAGIFILVGDAAGEAGPAVTLAFLLNGVIAMIVGAAYAELGAARPRAGGAYAWFQQWTVPALGFAAGWISWFAHAVACSLYSLGFASFTVALLERLWGTGAAGGARQWIEPALAVGVVVLFGFINHRGARETGLAENIVTSLKVLILLLLAAFGLAAIFGSPQPLSAFRPFFPQGLLGVGTAMGLTFIAFEGYEIIAQSGEEVQDPGRNIPRAIFISVGAAIVLYVLIAFVLIGGVEPGSGSDTVWGYLGRLGELGIVRAAGQLMPAGDVVLLVAGMASTMSALNATVYSSSRVAFAMGRDGHLPAAFGRVHGENETPDFAILVSGALIAAMALTLPIHDVAASADIMFLLLFVGVNYLVIRMRRRRPDLERPFRMPAVPWLPGFAMLAGVGLAITLVHLSVAAWITAGVWFGLGVGTYFGYARRHVQN